MTKAGRYAILGDLALVFAVALGFRLMWVVLIPPWASPDEPSHFTYVAHIAEQGELPHPPPYEKSYPDISPEVTESWDVYQIARISRIRGPGTRDLLPHLSVDHDYKKARAHRTVPERRLTAAGATASDYPPLYYAILAGFYRLFHESPLLARLYAARSASALLGALSCCFGYLFAFELRRSRRWGHVLGLSMALMPMYVFINASVNNDSGAFLCATALCWLLVRAFRATTVRPLTAAWIGIASGLALLMKPTALSLVIAAGGLMLYWYFPVLRNPWRLDRQRVARLGALALGVVVTAGPWMVFRAISASEVKAEATTDGVLVQSLLSAPRHSFGAYLAYEYDLGIGYFKRLFIVTYWAAFGWLDLYLSSRTYDVILGGYALAGVGIVVQWFQRPAARPVLALLGILIMSHVAFLFLIADYYLSFARTGGGLGLQGRYFFTTLAPTLFLVLSGLSYLSRDHPLFLRLAPVGMLVLQLMSLDRVLTRYYGVGLL